MTDYDPDAEVLDLSALDRLREIVGGDEAFLVELIHTFLEDAPQEIAHMHRALESWDVALLRRAAHSLKSNSADFGATVLYQMCQELEEMGKQGVFDGAAEWVSKIEAEYAMVEKALRAVSRT
ncbi:MAG TPA: Hpt domain-containing protein [Chloroflexi bacterium]|nr:Hpt domain-containing protein [Chloroflexota bacterium]